VSTTPGALRDRAPRSGAEVVGMSKDNREDDEAPSRFLAPKIDEIVSYTHNPSSHWTTAGRGAL